jgi:uncharacterized protein (TIGR02145 family)
MRKSVLFIILLFVACIVFAQQTLFRNSSLAGFIPQSNDNFTSALSPQDEGVVINGVRWATRNVDAPGTFAANPEDAGMFYQWNRKMAWATTGNVSSWDNSIPSGTTWERTNDPCPAGWRVPTESELTSLSNESSAWTTRNGINGRLFGTVPNQIFLPATGWRDGNNGALSNAGTHGTYRSSTFSNGSYAWNLFLISTEIFGGGGNGHRTNGFSVRCVAEYTPTSTSHDISITDISLNKTSVTLAVGASESLTATISPNNATNQNVTWSSSNTAVATVNASGRITAVSAGTVTIIVSTEDGGRTASANITVQAPQTEVGVVINGVRWATRNVDAPGTFAANPEDVGGFYGWNSQGTTNNSSSTSWTRANEPCPAGWRVPTPSELMSLENVRSTWTTRNGRDGRLFGTAPNQIFLPTGHSQHVGVGTQAQGIYWSNRRDTSREAYGSLYAWRLYFNSSSVGSTSVQLTNSTSYSVRCVAE